MKIRKTALVVKSKEEWDKVSERSTGVN